MARKRKTYDDDDGRTIVDMSGVDRPSMFGHLSPPPRDNRPTPPAEEKPERPWENSGYNRGERNAAIFGALKAGLLVGLAYIVGLAALIAFLLYVVW